MYWPKLKHESGMVILLVMMAAILGTILIGSFTNAVIGESRNSNWQKNRIQSLFLAEAGVEKGLFFLNRPNARPDDWAYDDNGLLATPVYFEGTLDKGKYKISIHSPVEETWLPVRTYLIRAEGILTRVSGNNITHKVSCVAGNIGDLRIPAALGIFDDSDLERELMKFDSASWTVDGRDIDRAGGLPGIAVANIGDDINAQLGVKINQVMGSDKDNKVYVGDNAILRDPTLPKNLDDYVTYFKNIAIDVSGSGVNGIPDSLLGSPTEYQVLYADLSKGTIKIGGGTKGYGVLVLEGDGLFELDGGAEWYGVVISAGNSYTRLKGGGAGTHIFGACLIANGTAEMNGTCDIRYSSDAVAQVNAQLLLYQVYSWCDGWGKIL